MASQSAIWRDELQISAHFYYCGSVLPNLFLVDQWQTRLKHINQLLLLTSLKIPKYSLDKLL